MSGNFIIISGIIVIALGTYLMYYGSTKESNKDKTEINSQLQKFNEKLDKVSREDVSSEVKEEKIKEVKNEFEDWASEFVRNKEQIKIAYQKENLGRKEQTLKLHEDWVGFYEDFFFQFESFIEAFNNSQNEYKIEIIQKSPIPKNIFSFDENEFFYLVKFKEGVYWKVNLGKRSPGESPDIPYIQFYVLKEEKVKRISFSDLFLIPSIETKDIIIIKNNSNYFNNVPLEGSYSLENPNKVTREIVKALIQFQIIKMEKV